MNDPPANPIPGNCILLGEAPTGDWGPYANHIASFTNAGWRFVSPVIGMTAFIKSTSSFATYGAGGWEIGIVRGSMLLIDGEQVIGPRAQPIDDPAGGGVVDLEARLAVAQILTTMRQHGLISS